MKFSIAASLLALSASSALAAPTGQAGGSVFTVPIQKDLSAPKVGIAQRNANKWQSVLASNGSASAGVINQPAKNIVDTYTASVGVGSPAQTFQLLIDTGSSNTFVGTGSTKYKKTSTGKDTGETISVSYGSGSFSGEEYTDQVTLGSLVIKNQGVAVAKTSQGFTGVDGILGVGPKDLTQGTTSGGEIIPTVVDTAKAQGKISKAVLGIYYHETNSTAGVQNGELTYGGVDTSKISGSVAYYPVTTTSPASLYWGIDASAHYGTTAIMSKTSGIVDTGTTLVLLATNYFNKFKTATGGTVDSASGLLKIPSNKVSTLKNFSFTFGSKAYTLTPDQYLVPAGQVTTYGGVKGGHYALIGDLGSIGGQGLDFIAGLAFLEAYYSVFDSDQNRIGFATRK